MRPAGVIPQLAQAQRFSDYLLSSGIENRLEPVHDGVRVWIYDEAHVERAKSELAVFRQEPENTRYDRGSDAQRIRQRERHEQEAAKRQRIDVRTTWNRRGGKAAGRVTVALVITCAVLHLVLHYGPTTPLTVQLVSAFRISLAPGHLLTHLQAGEFWRLVTPILLHGSLLHVAFNMLWLYSLGSQIEVKRGAPTFVGIVLAAAVVGNVAQYLWAGPNFWGMSGVVYGLFGFVWLQSRTMTNPDIWIEKGNVVLLVGWLLFCMTGLLGPIANAAHVGGLAAGLVCGVGPYLRERVRR